MGKLTVEVCASTDLIVSSTIDAALGSTVTILHPSRPEAMVQCHSRIRPHMRQAQRIPFLVIGDWADLISIPLPSASSAMTLDHFSEQIVCGWDNSEFVNTALPEIGARDADKLSIPAENRLL